MKKYFSYYCYIVKYDTKTDKLLFLDHQSEEISSEFERKNKQFKKVYGN